MNFAALYDCCASQPNATAIVQWGDHDVFKVGGKMFAILGHDLDAGWRASVRVDAESFDELCGEPGVRPAPHLARYHWVQITGDAALGPARLRALVARSHQLVFERLPASHRRALESPAGSVAPRPSGRAETAPTARGRAAARPTVRATRRADAAAGGPAPGEKGRSANGASAATPTARAPKAKARASRQAAGGGRAAPTATRRGGRQT
jgi:predicted DNA-binding protein (MmcQ/YjbR family)